jgi:xylulose-5-phosphate/fructose-6-phosphate phosphoketolase
LNDLDRYHLVIDVIERVPGLAQREAGLRRWLDDQIRRHRAYIEQHGEDMPEVRDWNWTHRT